jgi:hypothetical protein
VFLILSLVLAMEAFSTEDPPNDPPPSVSLVAPKGATAERLYLAIDQTCGEQTDVVAHVTWRNRRAQRLRQRRPLRQGFSLTVTGLERIKGTARVTRQRAIGFVRFKADWQSGREHGGCFLALPALVGKGQVGKTATVRGVNRLASSTTPLLAASPGPSAVTDRGSVWRCRRDRGSSPLEPPNAKPGATGVAGRSCAAIVTLSTPGDDEVAGMLALLSGIALALGTGLLIRGGTSGPKRSTGSHAVTSPTPTEGTAVTLDPSWKQLAHNALKDDNMQVLADASDATKVGASITGLLGVMAPALVAAFELFGDQEPDMFIAAAIVLAAGVLALAIIIASDFRTRGGVTAARFAALSSLAEIPDVAAPATSTSDGAAFFSAAWSVRAGEQDFQLLGVARGPKDTQMFVAPIQGGTPVWLPSTEVDRVSPLDGD